MQSKARRLLPTCTKPLHRKPASPANAVMMRRMLREWIEHLREIEIEWQPVSRAALIAWSVFYLLVLWSIARAPLNPFFDVFWVPIHEGGHVLFGWFGEWLGVAGGTLLPLLAAGGLLAHFALRGHTTGAAFCAFFLFENLIGVSIYMADARAIALDYVSIGGGDGGDMIHDWQYMFLKFGVLQHDTKIAAAVRGISWLGMLAAVAWLAWMHHKTKDQPMNWE